jgi:hypothetical protein
MNQRFNVFVGSVFDLKKIVGVLGHRGGVTRPGVWVGFSSGLAVPVDGAAKTLPDIDLRRVGEQFAGERDVGQ